MSGAGSSDEPAGAARLTRASERIESLLTASATHGALAQERAEELVHVVVDLYGAGLGRVMEVLDEAGRLDDTALDALAGDPLVSGLLLVHGLHPDDVPTRVLRALDSVRPYLGSHGGDVELVDVSSDGVVRLRLTGSCDGCASSAATLELAVEGAVRDAAPEITTIEVEQPSAATTAGSLIGVDTLFSRTRASTGGGWHEVPADEVADVAERVTVRDVAGIAVALCRSGTELFAFRDHCPACGSSLGGAALVRRAGGAVGDAVLRCPGCGQRFAVRDAGAGLDGDEPLEPLPLLVRDGTVQVAVPQPGEPAAGARNAAVSA